MKEKLKKSFGISAIFFVVGTLFMLLDGERLAIRFSRPWGASSWSTTEGMINAYSFIPLIIGSFSSFYP